MIKGLTKILITEETERVGGNTFLLEEVSEVEEEEQGEVDIEHIILMSVMMIEEVDHHHQIEILTVLKA